MRRYAHVVAGLALLLAASPATAEDTIITEGFNNGDEGLVVVAVVGPAPELISKHDITSKCAYKATGRPNTNSATYTVTGKTHAGPHSPVATSTIRCRLIDQN